MALAFLFFLVLLDVVGRVVFAVVLVTSLVVGFKLKGTKYENWYPYAVSVPPSITASVLLGIVPAATAITLALSVLQFSGIPVWFMITLAVLVSAIPGLLVGLWIAVKQRKKSNKQI